MATADAADHELPVVYRASQRVRVAIVSSTHHAKTYVTGLAAASGKTVEGIAREVLPAQCERALNKFLTEYDWDVDELNHERLEELQNHGETRWSQDGYIIIDDSVAQRTGEELPGVGRFYDHSEGETVWGQNLVYAFYVDDKTAYPLTMSTPMNSGRR